MVDRVIESKGKFIRGVVCDGVQDYYFGGGNIQGDPGPLEKRDIPAGAIHKKVEISSVFDLVRFTHSYQSAGLIRRWFIDLGEKRLVKIRNLLETRIISHFEVDRVLHKEEPLGNLRVLDTNYNVMLRVNEVRTLTDEFVKVGVVSQEYVSAADGLGCGGEFTYTGYADARSKVEGQVFDFTLLCKRNSR